MIRNTIFCLILICLADANAANPNRRHFEPIDLPITVRVDTTDTDIKAVYDLVRNFLSARPDSIYDNPYWNGSEKKKFAEPFPLRPMLFPNQSVINSYPPKVLSIEKEGDYFCARVLFYREGLEESLQKANPLAVARFYAKKTDVNKTKEEKAAEKEQGIEDHREYRLYDPLKILTGKFHHKRVGPVDYYYPSGYYFDNRTALRTSLYCQALKNKYELPDVEPIEFYITHDGDEMAEILGLDYFLYPVSGRSIPANAQLFSALAIEWYPHEIVHIFFRDFKPHFLLMEGIATYEGGSLNIEFDELVKNLAGFFERYDTLTFQNILDNPFLESGTAYYYTVGGVLCKMAYDKGGAAAVKALLSSGTSDDELYDRIEFVLGIKREQVTEAVRLKVKEYAGPK